MKYLKASIFLSLVILLSSMAPEDRSDKKTEDKGISFHVGTFDEAVALANEQEKLVFLDIYASWCGPCKALKSRTFPNEEVGEFFNANFINVAFDAEKGEGIDLASKFQVNAYPTLVFVNGNGELIARTLGYHNPKELLSVGKEVMDAQ